MAKVVVAGDAVIITSTVKFEDIKKLQRFAPEALVLKDEEGEPQFAIATTEGCGNINTYGASFNGEARDGSGKATITMDIGGVEGDLKQIIADTFGGALAQLKVLEGKIPEAIAKVDRDREAIIADITLV